MLICTNLCVKRVQIKMVDKDKIVKYFVAFANIFTENCVILCIRCAHFNLLSEADIVCLLSIMVSLCLCKNQSSSPWAVTLSWPNRTYKSSKLGQSNLVFGL